MKYIIAIVVIALVTTLWIFSERNRPVEEPATDTPATTTSQQNPDETTDNSTVPNTWVTYQKNIGIGGTLSIMHPPQATWTQIQPNTFELKYIGPNSEPNTEITDGYYVSVQFATSSKDTYVAAATNATPRPTQIAGYPAAVYESESALGTTVTHYVLALTDQVVVDFSVSVAGERASAYSDEVAQIMNSLTVRLGGSTEEDIAMIEDLIRVDAPVPGAEVASPAAVSGEARGYWFFEASASVVVTDWDGRIIGEGIVTTDGDWMTESFVPFSGTVTFTVPADTAYQRGTVILERANPSGLPENSQTLEIPVNF